LPICFYYRKTKHR